jgi:hypothetical protein
MSSMRTDAQFLILDLKVQWPDYDYLPTLFVSMGRFHQSINYSSGSFSHI